MDIFNLGDQILALLEMVFGFWNNQISLVFSMLGQSPVNFKGGGPWAVIAGIEPIFVAVGSSLVVLFFVIGFCSESIDIREEMRFEVILRMLIRLGLAEWFVANNVTIMKAFFTSIGNLVNLLSAGNYTTLTIDSTQADIIKNLGFGESLMRAEFCTDKMDKFHQNLSAGIYDEDSEMKVFPVTVSKDMESVLNVRGIDLDDAIEVAANVISMAEVHMDKQKAR